MPQKSYKRWSPRESFLFPPSPSDWLPEDHLAWFILDLVEELDLEPFHAAYAEKDPRGERPFDPAMMVALLLYGYANGIVSSRQIEEKTHSDVAFRVLAGGHHPHFTTLCHFRRTHAERFAHVFLEVLRTCRRMGMVDLGRVTLDGSKVQASASKHRAMSYDRMVETEAQLQEEIDRLLALAEQTDLEEDQRFGPDGRPYDVPAELARREARLAKLREARSLLEAEAREARAERLRENAARLEAKAEEDTVPTRERKAAQTLAKKARAQAAALVEEEDDDDDGSEGGPSNSSDGSSSGPTDLPTHRTRHRADGTPHPRAQHSDTDRERRIMEHKGGFVQAYNVQAVVSADGLIVAAGVSNQAPDTHYMRPMLNRLVEQGLGGPDVVLADSGYWARTNAAWGPENDATMLIATGRESYCKPWEIPGSGPPRTCEPQRHPATKEEMTQAVRSTEGWKMYRHRKHQAETPFGLIKRTMGFRQTHHRGLRMVDADWNLVCAAYDLRKLHRASRTTPS